MLITLLIDMIGSQAASLGVLIWLASFFLPFVMIGSKGAYITTQLLICLLPNMCLYFGLNIVDSWELKSKCDYFIY